MRQKMVAGNWKMNKSFQEAEQMFETLAELMKENKPEDAELVVCPSFPYLELAMDMLQDTGIAIGAQNCYPKDYGAYTGEVSAAMLNSLGVQYCIIGHSERRAHFKEDGAFLAEKVKSALINEIVPIFCCGEHLPEREKGQYFQVVERQLKESLFFLSAIEFSKVIIAYEPVWAIGTGVNASPEQAQEMHQFIRQLITKNYGEDFAEETLILYGGSCNSANAKALFENPDVDGGLIGGASLKPEEFLAIANSF